MEVAAFRGDDHPLVPQSRRMEGIQSAIPGGFDAIRREEILGAVSGTHSVTATLQRAATEEHVWPFSSILDVRDETVARFAGARFRSTFPSLRPLLAERGDRRVGNKRDADNSRLARTRAAQDDQARTFALGLIENWPKIRRMIVFCVSGLTSGLPRIS
jgi:hypothetical protein